MTVITEPLDRVAQSHIEGRVQKVRPSAEERIAALANGDTIARIRARLNAMDIRQSQETARSMMMHCAHCNAPYDEDAGVFLHVRECPCNQRGTTK